MRAEVLLLSLLSALWVGAATAQSPNPFLSQPPPSPETSEQDEREDPAIQQARAEWVQVLAQQISMKWLRPPGVPLGLRVKLRIEIAETGKVERVEVAESSGNETFDTSARFAVLKASPLPLPADPRAFVPVLVPTLMPAAPKPPANSF